MNNKKIDFFFFIIIYFTFKFLPRFLNLGNQAWKEEWLDKPL